jgi:HSP20 family protein
MDRLFEGILRDAATTRGVSIYTPRVDLVETPSEVRVSAELPGLAAEDFQVELKDAVLRIHGEKIHAPVDKDETLGWHRAERRYGRFERAIRVPCEVEGDAVNAVFRDGVLTVTLPKAASAQVREIPIEAASS